MARSIIYAGYVVALILPASAVAQPASDGCGGESAGNVTVASVIDGRTFMTGDHREVRLAGIETAGNAPALRTAIAGKTVTLRRTGEDRYGRVVAYAVVDGASVQQQLLRAGAAYVAPPVGAKPCADALFAAERAAHEAERGLWADPELRPKSAANREEISRAKGRFALVEGRILGVRESGGAIYLNFGRYYTRDFSVMILRRNAARFAIAPKLLQDKRIRVRGVVEMRRGPTIEAKWPEQIELIE
jgi:endonuclease YncB( thermonuclease family)